MISISPDTLSILKNFSGINPNVILRPGQKIKTISEAKNILAIADVAEDFPRDMGIYDLNEFLSVFSIVDDGKLEFNEKSCNISNGKSRVQYFFSEPSILTTPQKDITMPSCEVNLTFTKSTLDQVRKAASVLGHTEMAIVGSEEGIQIRVQDSKDATANTYEMEVSAESQETPFEFVMNISNLKIMDGDYNVGISSKLISNWKNTSKSVEYFIALEKSSKYGV
jgi:hypothetical protein